MKKIILSVLIIPLFFTIGIVRSQEKEISEEEKVPLRKKLFSLYEERKEINKEIEDINKKLEGDLLTQLIKDSNPELIKASQAEEELEKLKGLLQIYFSNKSRESEPDEEQLKELKEENDRLEDLMWDLERIRGDLEMERWKFELAKPDPLDFMKAYEMFKPYMEDDLWFYWWLIKK